jgi:photosystem II stability/assembly factor-like uncharacterized protein
VYQQKRQFAITFDFTIMTNKLYTLSLLVSLFIFSSNSLQAQTLQKVSNLPVGGGIQSLKQLNDSTAFVVIGKHIYKSADTAKTWTKIGEFFSNEPYEFRGLAVVSDQKIYSLSTRGGRLRYTHTGKAPWQEVTLPISRQGSDIQMLDENNGFAVLNGNSGGVNKPAIIKTTDGGLNWTFADTLPQTAYDSKIYFNSTQTGWVLNNNGIYQTKDGGTTWTLQVLDSFSPNAYNMSMLSTTKGFLCSGGNVYQTADGGSTWVKINHKFENPLDVAFKNDQTGYVVGRKNSKSNIYKTTDGGTTWNALTEGEWIERISIKDDVILLSGTNNNVWRLIDSTTSTNPTALPKYLQNIASVFPNPFSENYIDIELKQAVNHVTIIDVTGKVILDENQNFSMGKNRIVLPTHVSPGIYYIILTDTDNYNHLIKAIKN